MTSWSLIKSKRKYILTATAGIKAYIRKKSYKMTRTAPSSTLNIRRINKSQTPSQKARRRKT
jgi:hypothetical protein